MLQVLGVREAMRVLKGADELGVTGVMGSANAEASDLQKVRESKCARQSCGA